MGFDNLSPIAPAPIHALLVPAGNVKRSRFADFVSRVEEVKEVQLVNVSPSEGSNKNAFSSSAFPSGSVLYSISSSETVSASVESFPFELNREPQVVIAVADGEEIPGAYSGELEQGNATKLTRLGYIRQLVDEFESYRLHFRRAVLWHMLVFDSNTSEPDLNDVSFVPRSTSNGLAAMRAIMCDITSMLLDAFNDLGDDLQRFPALESPRTISSAVARDRVRELAEKSRQRMSLPSLVSSDFKSSGSSPSSGGNLSPGIGAGTPTDSKRSKTRPAIIKMAAEQISRENSSTSNSILGSGNGALPSPRLPTSKGRLRMTIGAMKMQCGLWSDALKDLSEGVVVARANSDYLWQARGLEYLLVCMLLFVWKDLSFEIPSICLRLNEKSSTDSGVFYAPANSTPGTSAGKPPQNTVYNLTSLVPDIMNTILTLYQRASTFTNDKLPQLLFCELRIRLVGLHSTIHLRGGTLDKQALQHLIAVAPIANTEIQGQISRKAGYRKDELSSMLLKAVPESLEDVKPSDTVRLLVGISSILAKLRLGRKQAFILKEILSILTPSLVEARKVGAAEMGIHPAAGLSIVTNASTEESSTAAGGVQSLLSIVCSMYAVPQRSGIIPEVSDLSLEAIGEKMRRWAYSRYIGDAALKIEILEYCISICEAIPDFQGILTFVVELLHTTRNAITLPPSHESGPPSIHPDEQKRLLNTVKRTVEAATRMGQNHIQAEYWDDFLVRSIQPLSPSDEYLITPHTPQDLVQATGSNDAVKRDPFIYSSFSKQLTKADIAPLLVLEEIAHFSVILQNPYEFDVEIERISLLTEGSDFVASDHSIVLGPYSSQTFVMSGRPTACGQLAIIGCKAKIRYCHERTFHVFGKTWVPEPVSKLKGSYFQRNLEITASSAQDVKQRSLKIPEAETISLTVLEAQPSLSIVESSLPQSALMLLEGEIKTFLITLKNTSARTDIDFLIFSFQDSVTTQLQDALAVRELSPSDVYELQLQLTARPSMRWVPDDGHQKDLTLHAGEAHTFKFEIFGKSGLLNGFVQIDYARTGVPRAELKSRFYTRQLRFPISLTVNGGIEVLRCNILPFSNDFAWSNQARFDGKAPRNGDTREPNSSSGSISKARHEYQINADQFTSILSQLGLDHGGDKHCLLLLDLRNVWPHPLSISITVDVPDGTNRNATTADAWRPAYTTCETLEPGYISRVVLLIPRMFVPNPYAPIPLIGKQRQFVVSASKLSAETEAGNREAFWFREELLKYIKGSWKEESSGRHGRIEIRRGIRLTPRMIDAMRIDEVEFEFHVTSEEVDLGAEDRTETLTIAQVGRSRFKLPTTTFAKLTVRIRNNTADSLHILLRLQPSLRNQPHTIALDLSKRFAWTGMLQRALSPPVPPGEVREAELGIMALCEGDFEIGATAEEIMPVQRSPDDKVEDPLIAVTAKRRIWHAREPCLIDAVDEDLR